MRLKENLGTERCSADADCLRLGEVCACGENGEQESSCCVQSEACQDAWGSVIWHGEPSTLAHMAGLNSNLGRHLIEFLAERTST